MKSPRLIPLITAFALALTLSVPASAVVAASGRCSGSCDSRGDPGRNIGQFAQASEPAPRELQPRYEPEPARPASAYNNEYVFGLTRGVADSTMHPAAKVLVFPITVPLDVALLPFELIGGFF